MTTFVTMFAWTPEAKRDRRKWTALMDLWSQAREAVYPDAAHVHIDVPGVPAGDHFPLYAAPQFAKARHEIRGPIIFTDVDVVCHRRIDPFEGRAFDVGLTTAEKQYPLMPWNAGVIFAADTTGAQLFLDLAAYYADNVPPGVGLWWVYQLAMGAAHLAVHGRVVCSTFPHEKWNYSPGRAEPTDAYFVHLKGDRKPLMNYYVQSALKGADK